MSNWTGDVDWGSVASGGGKFAFIHATEGTDYRNPRFADQHGGAAGAGVFRGSYHFAQPHESGGAAQAEFFVRNGGRWTSDGRTLPGVLDLEDNPYRNKNGKNLCYGLSTKEMVAWIKAFTTKYRQRTGRRAIIYTTTSWWRTCTGDSAEFRANPLWLARWGDDPGELPKSWKKYTFWQSADKGPLVGGRNVFNGTTAALKALADPPAAPKVSGAAKSRRLYTVTVTNTSSRPITKIRLSGRTYGGQHVVKAPGCSFSGTAVRCEITKLAPGEKATFTFATKPKGNGPVGMHVTVGSTKLNLRVRSAS